MECELHFVYFWFSFLVQMLRFRRSKQASFKIYVGCLNED